MLALPAESDGVGFKETLHWDVKEGKFHEDRVMDVQKAICAMLNRTGGTILLGVQDSGNKPVGIARDMVKYKSPDAFQRKVAEAFGVKLKPDPSELVNVGFIEIDGVTLGRIDVRPDRTHHFALQDKVYVRRDGESRELTGPNLAAWAARRSRGEA
jgi:predicted HTH transcriptional regulator